MKRPTIADIAKRAGVSKGAASYALNGRPGVSDVTRSRVTAIAEHMGWVPNSAARALSDGRAGAVGMIIDRTTELLGVEPFFMRLIAGIENELRSGETSLLLQVSGQRDAEREIYRRWYAEHRVDGILLVDLRDDDPRPDLLTEIGFPTVALGGPLGRAALPSAWMDDGSAIDEVLNYLAGIGHRRIVRIAGPPEFIHTRVRSQAFEAAAARLDLDEARSIHTDYTDEGGAAAARRVLVSARPPTALVFDNDVMAVAALGVAYELGRSVPGDLSLVAWDDSVLCRLVHPALSAVRRPVTEYGELAVSMLRRLIAGETVEDASPTLPILITRSSTGPPAQP